MFRFAISFGIAILLILWASQLLVARKVSQRGAIPALLLALLAIYCFCQIIPLPQKLLATLSPASAELIRESLPIERELLPGELDTHHPSSRPISLTPYDSRFFLIKVLIATIVFAAVIQNLASPAFFYRLAWVCVVNGTLLSFLAIAQFLSSPRTLIYWSIKTEFSAFGPFLHRNHFDFYINVCIGLGLGLLLASTKKKTAVLQNPRAIWLLAALFVMSAANVLSLSRGGLFCLLGSTMIGGLVWAVWGKQQGGSFRWIAGLTACVGIFMAWYGWGKIEQRYNLPENKNITGGRLEVWRESLQICPSFPIFGTGNGSFELIELRTRRIFDTDQFVYNHAHNEYVEALVEGGIIRLGLTLALIAFVSYAGIRNYRRLADRSIGWLVLGGLVGFWAIVLQSTVDYGIHVPAVALLAMTVSAQVVAARSEVRAEDYVTIPRSISVLLAVPMIVLAGLVVWDGYQRDRAKRYENAAIIESRSEEPDAAFRRTAYLRAAVLYQPESSRLHFDLGDAYLGWSRQAETSEVAESRLREALLSWRRSRDLCPIGSLAQARLALYQNRFQRADPVIRYLERARQASPTNPTLWYGCGLESFGRAAFDDAWKNWRQSLTLSTRHLSAILKNAAIHLTSIEIIEKVLPEQPEVIHAAALNLYPDSVQDFREKREPFQAKARGLLERKGSERAPKDDWLLGRILFEQGSYNESVAILKQGLLKDQQLHDCRLELVRVFCELERFEEARSEVKIILVREPGNALARDQLDVITRELKIREP
ncbi:MAG: O-antigen ligase family protein [Planctomycetes bacterium]|nr:O-antigen ligase family protein [Planctomycetota bacterium]